MWLFFFTCVLVVIVCIPFIVVVWNIYKQKPEQFPSEKIVSELIPWSFEVVKDVDPSEFEISDLEPVSFREVYGDVDLVRYPTEESLRSRAIALDAGLGLVDLARVKSQSDKIPPGLRGKVLVFMGTILRERKGCGRRRFAYLAYTCEVWYVGFDSFSDPDHRDERRLLRIKSAGGSR